MERARLVGMRQVRAPDLTITSVGDVRADDNLVACSVSLALNPAFALV